MRARVPMVLAVMTVAGWAAGASPASALHVNPGNCVNGTYSAQNQLTYSSLTATEWAYNSKQYQFAPPLNNSIHNNQNLHILGPEAHVLNSNDDLIRDGAVHTDPKTFGATQFRKNSSSVYFHVAFDVPGAADPGCDSSQVGL